MRTSQLLRAATAATAVMTSCAHAGIIGFVGDSTLEWGWDKFDEVQPYGEMEVILNGHEPGPPFELVDAWPTSCGPVALSLTHDARHVQQGWATWSHGYTGEVFYTLGGLEATYTMPPGIGAFDFYVEPNAFSIIKFTAVGYASDGTDSGPMVSWIAGASGASHFGFYTTGGAALTHVHVSAYSDFAIGEMRIVAIPAPAMTACLAIPALRRQRHRRPRAMGGTGRIREHSP